MRLVLFFFLLLASFLSATTVVTENDPSTLVNGVSVITGDLYTFDEEFVVQGVEPIRVRRAYLSSFGDWNLYPHLFAQRVVRMGFFEVREANGTSLRYYLPWLDPFKKKKKKPEALRLSANIPTTSGITNTASGHISAHTNYENQYLLLDEDRESFTVFAANGTKRLYRALKNQKPQDLGFGTEGFLQYFYALHLEELPNGNKIRYLWNDKNQLELIRTESPRGKIYASITLPHWNPNHPPAQYRIIGNNGQSLWYEAGYRDPEKQKFWTLKSIISPTAPKKQLSYDIKKCEAGGQKFKMPYLQKISLPDGRDVAVEYEEWKDPYSIVRHRVKKLLSPTGPNQTLQVSHIFSYFPEEHKSHVIDADGNKTAYFWNGDSRLTQIDSYEKEKQLHHSERFIWDGIRLRCKAYFDAEQTPIWARTFEYDSRGNVKAETFFGQLSGEGSPLHIGENGFPIDDGVEKCIQKTDYTDDARNLPIKQEQPSGLIIRYDYYPNTHLLKTKLLCDGEEIKTTQTYEYDEDLILIRETTDDGLTKTIRQITPKRAAPYYGMPETIEEKYEKDGREILLRKEVLHYETGGRLQKKDIYDADDKYRYSLTFTYNGKGQLETETNPLGWEATSKYDDLGNRKSYKDFGGRVDTLYDYDFSNRLVKQEETGFDKLRRSVTYEYDAKHNLIRETDHRGHATSYVPTPFGARAEIHLPQVPDEAGTLITPIVKASFDAVGNEILSTDAKDFATKTTYNGYGKPIHVHHPDDAEESWTYFVDGTLKTHTDAAGIITEYKRDYLGRTTLKTISEKKVVLADESFEYTGLYPTVKTDAEKHKTTFAYDRAGRKTSETHGGETTIFYYDALGRNYKTEKGNLRTHLELDLLGRTQEERQEDIATEKILRKTGYEYDAAGNQTAILRWTHEDSLQTREQFSYDSQNRLTSHTDPSGHEETVSYLDDFLNEHGQKVVQKTHTDPMGLQTVETFDSHGRVTKTEKRKRDKTVFSEEKLYDARGKIALQTNTVYDPDGKSRNIRTRWEYDAASRPIKLIEAEGSSDAKTTSHTYTPRGEKSTTTKPDGVVLTYEYNGLGHLKQISSSDKTVNHEMRYNKLGALLWSDGIEREVDANGRLLQETFPVYHIRNQYNSAGQRIECRIPLANCLIEYTYNGLDMTRVTRKRLDGTELYAHQYLARDLAGNLQGSELPHQLGKIQYHCDRNSRRDSVEAPHYAQKVLETDALGNILHLSTQQVECHFTYDDLYQLTSETGLFNHRYENDSLCCRLKKDAEDYEINDLNQVISHVEYDKNGNPTRQGNTLYTFDALDRLIKIETPECTQYFTYDSQHRRLSATTQRQAGYLFTYTQQETRYFLYDGQKEIGSFNEQLEVIELRILGPTPHAEIDASIALELQGEVYAPIHDLCGNIAALIPFSGGPAQITHYGAFGEELGSRLSPWRFSSKRVDETGLVYYGRRFYQPELGRWLSPDPAGFTNGMNLYAFVGNSPLTHFDEYGLQIAGFNENWQRDESWQSWNQQSWNQKSWHEISTKFGTQPPVVLGPAYSSQPKVWSALTADASCSPHYYRNGIMNTPQDCIDGARCLQNTYGGLGNIIPAYAVSYGDKDDLISVVKSVIDYKNYMTDSIRHYRRNLKWDLLCMEAMNDPRKLFITCFSRGAADTYHAVKDFSQQLKDRLIITACGPIMILPRSLGFKVTNLISRGDWCSLKFHHDLEEDSAYYRSFANVRLLDPIDSNGLIGDHFFMSKTYQKGLKEYSFEDYQNFGVLR